MSVDTAAGRLVLTRIRTRRGNESMQVVAVVDLPSDPTSAVVAARQLVFDLCHAINPTQKARTR